MGGYGVVKAYNSIDGMHIFRQQAQDILAVILDLGTPKIEKCELFYKIKETITATLRSSIGTVAHTA